MEISVKRGKTVVLKIEDLAFGGKGIAKIPTEEGYFPVFVPNTIPGQEVHTRIIKRRKKYAEGVLLDVIKASEMEEKIPFQAIPGAPYATMPVTEQEKYKQQTTCELFRRIGKIKNPEALLDAYIRSPRLWNYRNKMEYSFSAICYDPEAKTDVDAFGLGFKRRGTWWMVEKLDKETGLFDAPFENELKNLRTWFEATALPPWHPPRKEGFFRFLIARKSFEQDQLLIDLVTTSSGLNRFDRQGFVQQLKNILGNRLAGVFHTLNDDIGDRSRSSAGNSTSSLIYGRPKITEYLSGLEFEISMESFFQPNPACAELLYGKTVDYALEENPEGAEKPYVMDLFCGTGTIAQILASRAKGQEVLGVDIVASAIEDARKNAARNGLEGLTFHTADVQVFLREYPQYANAIKTVVLDPPRGGIQPKALKRTIELNAPRIVYVSCNPATQARDMEVLKEAGYEVKKFSLIDQFPHTAHVETVVLFEKN